MALGERAAFDAPRARPTHWRRVTPRWRRVAAAGLALAGALYLVAYLRTPRAPQSAGGEAPAAPPVVASLEDGAGRVTLTADGTLTTPAPLSAAEQSLVRNALLNRQIPAAAALADLRSGAAPLMGGSAERRFVPEGRFVLIHPSATMVTAGRPAFIWSPLAEAIDYQVTIADVESNYREVVSSPPLRETNWTISSELPRGRTYSWQVVARTPTGEVKAPSPGDPEVKFHVLARDKADAIAKLAAERPQHHLLLGLAYAEAGLLDEAEAEFQALAAANPASDVARDLLLGIRKLRSPAR
jgi:hypothetical protein